MGCSKIYRSYKLLSNSFQKSFLRKPLARTSCIGRVSYNFIEMKTIEKLLLSHDTKKEH